MSKESIRVRIAPSPTGFLHLGTARTALFNLLFARSRGGKFILRIEDTDLERSEKRFEEDIINSLKWLGLDWDEGPYRQSERLDIYERYLKQLLEKKLAYYCRCTKEELERERQEQLKKGESPRYSGKCRDLDLPAERGQVIRFKLPETQVTFKDLIRGEITFDTGLMGDLAIAKNLRTPLYNFAVVIDDQEMKISHVIRGEDHIANTPKQILLQQALGFKTPEYSHLPLILDPDRSKMSKRYSATSIQEYKSQGYLPEALINFMALLGWHPADDREKMTLAELTAKFDFHRIQKAGAVFNIQKLNWLNGEYLKEKSNEDLWRLIKDFFGSEIAVSEKTALKILALEKNRLNILKDFKELELSFGLAEDYLPSLLIWKNSSAETAFENLKKVREILRTVLESEFDKASLERIIMPMAEARGRGETLWPLRVALTGREKSPGPFEVLDIVGKEESLKRIELALKKLEKLNPPGL